MLTPVTDDHLEKLLLEQRSAPHVRVWTVSIRERLAHENPVIKNLTKIVQQVYPNPGVRSLTLECICAVYRLLEIAHGPLPKIHPDNARPIQEEIIRGQGQHQKTWLNRMEQENSPVHTLLQNYIFKYRFIMRRDDKEDISRMVRMGVITYAFIIRQHEVDELSE